MVSQMALVGSSPGGDVRGSGATWPNLIRQMNPRREPIHNLIEAKKINAVTLIRIP